MDLDGGHKSVKKVMEKSDEFQHFTAVVVKWFGTCLALAKKGEIDEKQTLQMFHNCANHLQDHHSACPSDSPCHSDTFHLKLPNLVQADQGRIGRFRELLEKCYSSQPSGDKIACPGDTTPNEAYHNHATVFSPKAEDFPVSGPLRAALSALTHNVGSSRPFAYYSRSAAFLSPPTCWLQYRRSSERSRRRICGTVSYGRLRRRKGRKVCFYAAKLACPFLGTTARGKSHTRKKTPL